MSSPRRPRRRSRATAGWQARQTPPRRDGRRTRPKSATDPRAVGQQRLRPTGDGTRRRPGGTRRDQEHHRECALARRGGPSLPTRTGPASLSAPSTRRPRPDLRPPRAALNTDTDGTDDHGHSGRRVETAPQPAPADESLARSPLKGQRIPPNEKADGFSVRGVRPGGQGEHLMDNATGHESTVPPEFVAGASVRVSSATRPEHPRPAPRLYRAVPLASHDTGPATKPVGTARKYGPTHRLVLLRGPANPVPTNPDSNDTPPSADAQTA